MKTFAESLRETRRLVLLRLLSEQPGYRSNSSNLHTGLYALGIAGSRDDVITDLHWLRDQALLDLDAVPEVPGLFVANITARGNDVANGQASVPGISRPSPR
ncbi:ArsR family transcriptional regulator [Dyella lutea]|uniref:ArsR family transcriptional regulator n=1 Tax=Dyella lutea TaxID=2950441 RepID=A0ABT1FGX8_9GAMM|nr:ArsR family transcriptional regulator [Dyella lutea]MCP1375378.1 ArsR family transcriptional regulator [Dyella lutea]